MPRPSPRRADATRGTCRLPEPLVQDALAGVEQQDVGIALMLIDAPDDFQQGTVMPCLLPLPDGDIKLDFEIRHIQPSREGLRVGGQLLLQTEQQRQTLLRAIMRIERWWLQQRQ